VEGAAPEELSPASIGDSGALRVGQSCFALGNPYGYLHTLTSGVRRTLTHSRRGTAALAPSRRGYAALSHTHVGGTPHSHTLTSGVRRTLTHSRRGYATLSHAHVGGMPHSHTLTSGVRHTLTRSRPGYATLSHTHVGGTPHSHTLTHSLAHVPARARSICCLVTLWPIYIYNIYNTLYKHIIYISCVHIPEVALHVLDSLLYACHCAQYCTVLYCTVLYCWRPWQVVRWAGPSDPLSRGAGHSGASSDGRSHQLW